MPTRAYVKYVGKFGWNPSTYYSTSRSTSFVWEGSNCSRLLPSPLWKTFPEVRNPKCDSVQQSSQAIFRKIWLLGIWLCWLSLFKYSERFNSEKFSSKGKQYQIWYYCFLFLRNPCSKITFINTSRVPPSQCGGNVRQSHDLQQRTWQHSHSCHTGVNVPPTSEQICDHMHYNTVIA